MKAPMKGTVTPISSLYSPEEAQKASERVQEAISERQKELEQLLGFHSDNTSLINLVSKLPDHLHHDIMVPFGKAAFFPGRLIHTNEFLVLLGEGYFAERTSKQTVEILTRRGKGLESQIDGLKAVMQDLMAEVSFFSDTATQVAEGLVEIREDYIDEASTEDVVTAGVPKSGFDFPGGNDKRVAAAVEDEEYARLLKRMEELEKEELEAENVDGNEEDDEDNLDDHLSENFSNLELTSCEKQQSKAKGENSNEEGYKKDQFNQEFSDQFDCEYSKGYPVMRDSDISYHAKVPAASRSNITEKTIEVPKLKESGKVTPASVNEISVIPPGVNSSSSTSSSEAFTGSIIEHTHNLERNSSDQKLASASKPVSRFKQQRR